MISFQVSHWMVGKYGGEVWWESLVGKYGEEVWWGSMVESNNFVNTVAFKYILILQGIILLIFLTTLPVYFYKYKKKKLE